MGTVLPRALPRLAVFAGGEIVDPAAAGRWMADADLVVAADSGLGRALSCGVVPDVVVGDLDSAEQTDLEAARRAGATFATVSPVKDETDLELSVNLGVARLGAPLHILLAGITGGRLDHTAAALGLMLSLAREGHVVEAGDGQAWATVLGGERLSLVVAGEPGEYLSLVPLLGNVTGASLAGLRYPLTGAILPWGKSLGVSNEFTGTVARVEIESGWLLVVKPGRERVRP